MAFSATAIFAAAWLWPASATAVHQLECGPYSETVIDAETGRRRCVRFAPEVLEVLQRSLQLQLEQTRRTRALAQQQQPPTGAARRVRELDIRQQQREDQQSRLRAIELARQRQFSREVALEALQAPVELERTLNRLGIENRLEFDEARRRSLLRNSELRRSQDARAQQLALPSVELEGELRARQRLLERQQGQP